MERWDERPERDFMSINHIIKDPFFINKTKLKNRIVCPPMGTNYANEYGQINERLIEHYKNLIDSGVGMLILEATNVMDGGKITKLQICSYSMGYKDRLKVICDYAKQNNVAIIVQLCHGGMYGDSFLKHAVNYNYVNDLYIKEIEKIKAAFIEAAAMIHGSGASGIELHLAHGYLLSEFLSVKYNHRIDRYGGTPINRIRLTLEIVKGIRRLVGNEFIIQIRISAEDNIAGGNQIDDTKLYCKLLEEYGVNSLHITSGIKGTNTSSPRTEESARQMWKYAGDIKKIVRLPIIAVGKINSWEEIDYIINNELADLIAIGRPLIADSGFIKGLIKNETLYLLCKYCNIGCLKRAVEGKPIRCVMWKGEENDEEVV